MSFAIPKASEKTVTSYVADTIRNCVVIRSDFLFVSMPRQTILLRREIMVANTQCGSKNAENEEGLSGGLVLDIIGNRIR